MLTSEFRWFFFSTFLFNINISLFFLTISINFNYQIKRYIFHTQKNSFDDRSRCKQKPWRGKITCFILKGRINIPVNYRERNNNRVPPILMALADKMYPDNSNLERVYYTRFEGDAFWLSWLWQLLALYNCTDQKVKF